MTRQYEPEWVGRSELLNQARKHAHEDTEAFLASKGLLRDNRATVLALATRIARHIGGGEQWDLKKYVQLMKAHYKVEKYRARGKPIDPVLLARTDPEFYRPPQGARKPKHGPRNPQASA